MTQQNNKDRGSLTERILIVILTVALIAVILSLVGPMFLGHLGILFLLLGG